MDMQRKLQQSGRTDKRATAEVHSLKSQPRYISGGVHGCMLNPLMASSPDLFVSFCAM